MSATFDTGAEELTLVFDRGLAVGNLFADVVANLPSLGEAWQQSGAAMYTAGSNTAVLPMSLAGASSGAVDITTWDGTDGPIVFTDASELATFSHSPVVIP